MVNGIDALTKDCEEFARGRGADLFGVAAVEHFPGDHSKESHPRFFIKDARSVIVLGIKLVDAVWDNLTGTRDVHSLNLRSYLLHYNYDLLDYIGIQTARFLEDQGYDGYPVQARTETRRENVFVGYFPFKVAAVAAGLGSIGKNTQLLTPQFGPRQRLVAVITNAPLVCGQPEKPPLGAACGECQECIEACPVDALRFDDENGQALIDQARCQAQMDFCQCALCQGACIMGKQAADQRRLQVRATTPSRLPA